MMLLPDIRALLETAQNPDVPGSARLNACDELDKAIRMMRDTIREVRSAVERRRKELINE